MEYPNLNQENVHTYYPLGSKTLFMLILKKSPIFFAFLLAALPLLIFVGDIPQDYIDTLTNAVLAYAAFLLIVALLVFFAGWLQYFRYGIIVSEKNLIIKKGFIATEEIGIPFRRIRDMKIKRSLLDQVFGVSDILVTLSDFEEQDTLQDESIVSLPALEKNMAIQIQESILKKSQVEQIDVLSGHDNMLERKMQKE